MVKKIYKPSGNDKIGHRLHIPSYAELAKGYHCTVKEDGTLIYAPVVVQVNGLGGMVTEK
jgi:hypothetical protein